VLERVHLGLDGVFAVTVRVPGRRARAAQRPLEVAHLRAQSLWCHTSPNWTGLPLPLARAPADPAVGATRLDRYRGSRADGAAGVCTVGP
jgi:hypothetical protein